MQTRELKNKTVWVTGASSGIGLDVARTLAKQRNYVFVSARSERKLAQLKEAYPENIFVVPLDLCDQESITTAELTLRRHTDHLDVFIACAGTCEYDGNLSLDRGLYERVTCTNYLGLVESVRVALPLLRKSNSDPVILGVSSLSSLVPFPRAAAYGASKAAVDYFLQSLKIDLIDEKIDVLVVRPGFVDTPLTRRNDFDMPFLMSSHDASMEVLRALVKRKLFFDFPAKLSLPLKIMRLFPLVWMRLVAPKLRKAESL